MCWAHSQALWTDRTDRAAHGVADVEPSQAQGVRKLDDLRDPRVEVDPTDPLRRRLAETDEVRREGAMVLGERGQGEPPVRQRRDARSRAIGQDDGIPAPGLEIVGSGSSWS